MVNTRSWMPRAFSYSAASATINEPPGWIVLVVEERLIQLADARHRTNFATCLRMLGIDLNTRNNGDENVCFCMASRIHLVRHGVSAHVHDGSWVNAERARRFMELYDAAGIRDEPPPAEAIEAAATADIL